MSIQREASIAELFGLAGTFPQPGWVLLDALRDHRFTGELIVETTSTIRLYSDRGDIYLAERTSDPSIGNRLVDAGALTSVELEQGGIEIGGTVHLGRLFERVPSLDRHTVLVTAELMTDECVGWLAAHTVTGAVSTPYRHHESGIHKWSRAPGWIDLRPGDPLPAPPVDEEPVEVEPPADEVREDLDDSFEDGFDDGVDDVIKWNEPSWLDAPRYEAAAPASVMPDTTVTTPDDAVTRPAVDPASPEANDWVDRLEADGLPDQPDLLATPTPLPRMSVESIDRFELIWPTGEVDEEFGVLSEVVGGEHDRVGSTARLGSIDRRDAEAPEPDDQHEESVAVEATDHATIPGADEAIDEVVLAVRRAVASIEVGSLAARQRLVDATDSDGGSRGVGASDNAPAAIDSSTAVDEGPPADTTMPPDVAEIVLDEAVASPDEAAASADEATSPKDPLMVETIEGVLAPGRVAVRSGRNDWSRRTVSRSVFDEPIAEPEPRVEEPQVDEVDDDQRSQRSGALRRLISSLRR